MSGSVKLIRGQAINDTLERALEEVRSGEVVALTLVKHYKDGGYAIHSNGDVSMLKMIGAVAVAQRDLIEGLGAHQRNGTE